VASLDPPFVLPAGHASKTRLKVRFGCGGREFTNVKQKGEVRSIGVAYQRIKASRRYMRRELPAKQISAKQNHRGHQLHKSIAPCFQSWMSNRPRKQYKPSATLLKQPLRFRAPNANLLAASGTQHRELAGQQALEGGSTHPHDQTASNLYTFNL
jgi:hypothetical protein